MVIGDGARRGFALAHDVALLLFGFGAEETHCC